MWGKTIRIRTPNLYYACFVFFVMINYGLENTSFANPFRNINLLTALLFAVLCAFSRNYKVKDLLASVITILLGLCIYFFSHYTDFLLLILAVFLIQNINIDKILKMVFYERLFIFVFVNFLAAFGVIQNTAIIVNKYAYEVKGQAFGYVHPNSFSNQVAFLIMLYAALHRKELNFPRVLCIVLVECCNFAITRSRMALLMIGLLCFFLICIKSNCFVKYYWKYAMKVYPVVLFLNFLLIALFSRFSSSINLLHIINDSLFNGRIGLALMNLRTYPITLFGSFRNTGIISQKYNYFALDNGYVICLLYYGIVGFIILSFIYLGTMKYFKDHNELLLSVLLCLYVIWAMFEGQMITLGGNFIVLFLGKEIKTRNVLSGSKIKNGEKAYE